ncbi:dehydrogenase/reductase SDR family member 7 [Biomphalaria pfeifferi]|uniref:Dehydrogenase/reductase SDR family member 7 n=1 Tax=Biomphalaria pfeifferi TaxID=112525 RepID=A0AAD8FCZ3_BIOPF|nr:dehydrogenase/reductase SDR family member 7 [Biomphalaria pfeifferi]
MLMFRAKCCPNLENLSGKVVWITGASSGIGEHIAYQLASITLEVYYRRNKISDEDVLILPLDIVKFESHKAAVQKVLDHFHKIDILLNNAGKFQKSGWKDTELEIDREIFELNVLGPVSLTQAVLPHMTERNKGQIVVMSSLAGIMGAPFSRSYCCSKHALQGCFDTLRLEVGEHNIDVTVICPGPVVSQILEHAVGGRQGEAVQKGLDMNLSHMSTERCAYLSCVAIANRMYQVWITQNPILIVTYIYMFLPDLGKWMTLKAGLKRMLKD